MNKKKKVEEVVEIAPEPCTIKQMEKLAAMVTKGEWTALCLSSRQFMSDVTDDYDSAKATIEGFLSVKNEKQE